MIAMRSVKSSVKGSKTAAARVAVLIVIVVQPLGLAAVWPQEPTPPQVDEEIAKQEKIYRSQGADIPGGYITKSRALELPGTSSRRLL